MMSQSKLFFTKLILAMYYLHTTSSFANTAVYIFILTNIDNLYLLLLFLLEVANGNFQEF